MRRLGSTVARLTALRRAVAHHQPAAQGPGRLTAMTGFGANPGALDALIYVPAGLRKGAPLVVVLHGCTQNAVVYDRGSGWSALADRHGFALLYPQQRRANNSNLCFNWYDPNDARRGRGEAKSIAQMVEHMAKTHAIDASRTFVTGLSAGGAMTAVMLATYPDLFAGGAIIAGLPFASANTLSAALERMRGDGSPSRRELASRAKAAGPDNTVPTLSVWHGTRDQIVDSSNGEVIVNQWLDLHGLGDVAGEIDNIGAHQRTVWRNSAGRVLVEHYAVKGMGHGTPLDTKGVDSCGIAGPHMIEADICSSSAIAKFWGLAGTASKRAPSVPAKVTPAPLVRDEPGPTRLMPSNDIGAIIEDALRSAGLMR